MKSKMRKQLSVKELKFIIREAVSEFLYKNVGHASKILNMDPIVEMSRLNNKDIGAVPFPDNKFVIRIWSNDHNPPHFHVKAEGWDISFLIEDGKLYRVNKFGNSLETYKYIVKQVPKWLMMKSSAFKHSTNQEAAESIWASYDDNKKF